MGEVIQFKRKTKKITDARVEFIGFILEDGRTFEVLGLKEINRLLNLMKENNIKVSEIF